MSTRLIIVRHGETESNVAKIQQGWIDTPLTPLGQQQILRLGQRLATEKIDMAYSSPLLRSVRTTQAIINFHPDLLVEYTEELRERHWGIYEGRSVDEYTEDQVRSGVAFIDHRPEGGESLADLKQRMAGFLGRVLPLNANKSVLISTHHSAMKMLLFILLDKPLTDWEGLKMPNTALNILEYTEGSPTNVLLFNDAAHLAGL